MIESIADCWVSCPGKTVTKILWSRGIKIEDFRSEIGWTSSQCDMLFDGSLKIDEEVASDLGRAIGPSKSFWLQREFGYRRETTSEAKFLEQLPLRELVKLGWISYGSSGDHLQKVLDFFGVSSPAEWTNYWQPVVRYTSYKHTVAFDSELGAVASWLRRGELLSEQIKCNTWSEIHARAAIPEIRKLSRIKDPALFIPKLTSLCASFGVAVIVEKAPAGCRATGATRWLSPSRALLLLSGRYKTDDHFWFAFFHELGHLVLHRNSKMQLEIDGDYNQLEDEANKFAQDAIIPPDRWQELINLPKDPKAIARFSAAIGISRGLVVGQLQYARRLHHNQFNSIKRKLDLPT